MAILVASLLVGGWCAFSLCAGIVVYRSSMTRKGAASGLRKNADLNAHGKDPLVMDRINGAKARWERSLAEGSIERLSVRTSDGLGLRGYYLSARENQPINTIQRSGGGSSARGETRAGAASRAVILVHGIRDSAAGMAYLAEEYHAAGWNVLSVDLRAHGDSGGSVITMGVREGRDLSLWVDELASRHGCESVFLHGVSMGANAVLFFGSGARAASPPVKGLIVDSFFPSYREMAIRLLARVVGNRLVASGIARGASVVSALRSGVPFARMDAKRSIARYRSRRRFMPLFRCRVPARGDSPRDLPVLAFHGGKDAIVPLRSVTEFFSEGTIPDAELVVIPDAPHIGAYFYDRDRYLSKIDTFTRRFS